jgi:hypothetical protein
MSPRLRTRWTRGALAALALGALALAACDRHHDVTAARPPASPPPAPSPVPGDVCSGASPYTLAGYHWSAAAATYAYGSSLPGGWRASVDAAVATWNAAGSRLRIARDPVNGGATSARDGKSVVCVDALPSGVLGTTYTWYDTRTHTVTEADVVLTNAFPMTVGGSATSVDVQSVLTHEFGHFAGLDHVNDVTHTMYPSIPNGSQIYRTLCDGDLLGVRTLYP